MPDAASEKQQGGIMIINNTGRQISSKLLKLPTYLTAGVTKQQFNNEIVNFTASGTGDPGNLCKIQFAAADLRLGSSATVLVRIALDYKVQWYQRKDLAQS